MIIGKEAAEVAATETGRYTAAVATRASGDKISMNYRSSSPISGGTSGVVIVLTLAGYLVGCSPDAESTPDAAVPTAVEVQTIERSSIARVLSYTGDVVGEVEVRVFSMIPDRINSLRVEEGQVVNEGELIATIRAAALGQGVQQALGGLASARAQVAGLRDNLNRQRRLLSSGVVTQAQVDATTFQLQGAEAQVAQLQATVGSAQTRRADANIRAPLTGIVGQVFVEEGDLAAPQIPICTVVQMDRVEVMLQVPERDLGLVQAGRLADIRVATVPDRVFRAPVSRVSPVVDRLSRTATLRIMLENPDHIIRPGSLADVRLEVERHDGAIVVPQFALVLDERGTEDGAASYRAYVLEADGRTVDERRVTVGIYDGDLVEVTEGLREGERLIVQGQHLLRDESRVTVRQTGGGGGDGDAGAEEEDGGATAEGQE